MNLFFSDKPGSHERHLRRKVNNPLFGDLLITQAEIQAARERDEAELAAFIEEFQAIARDASGLDSRADADALIELKTRLEKNYEVSCVVMGNQDELRAGLGRLIDSIMRALLAASQQDEHAWQKLMEEHAARNLHFELLGHGLLADLVRADSPIQSHELLPALLSEQEKVVRASVKLFTDEQLAFLCAEGNRLFQGVDSDHPRIRHGRKMLKLLEAERDRGADDASASSGGLAS
jgi:hypothetical protein